MFLYNSLVKPKMENKNQGKYIDRIYKMEIKRKNLICIEQF